AWIDAPPLRWIGAPILVILLALAAARAGAPGVWGRSRPHLGQARARSTMRILGQPELALAAVAYLVLVLLRRTVAATPRPLLPLAPRLLVALAAGAEALLARARLGIPAVALLAATWLADGARLAAAHHEPSPAAALVGHLAAVGDDRPVITR